MHAASRNLCSSAVIAGAPVATLIAPALTPVVPMPLRDLADIQFGDFLHRARAPVDRQAHFLEIEPRGADHIHFGLFGNLPHQRGVAAKFDRAGIDEAAHAMFVAQLLQAPNRLRDEAGAVEDRGRIEFGARKRDEQMLVHQGAAKLIQSDWAGDGLDMHETFPL